MARSSYFLALIVATCCATDSSTRRADCGTVHGDERYGANGQDVQQPAGASRGGGGAVLPRGEHFANIEGVKLRYQVSGVGPPCFCITLGGTSADIMARTMKCVEQLFTMVYLDAPGTGGSKYNDEDEGARYSATALLGQIDSLRAHLGLDKIWLLGHFESGTLAVRYASQHPSHCAGIVLVANCRSYGMELALDCADAEGRRRMEDEALDQLAISRAGKRDWSTDKAFKRDLLEYLPFLCYDEHGVKRVRSAIEDATWSTGARDYGGEIQAWDITRDLAAITVPTVVIAGSIDVCCPLIQAEKLHLAIASSKFIVVDRAGHYPWIERPDRFADGLERALNALGTRPRSD